jgi:N-acetyl sugar amidotransferase
MHTTDDVKVCSLSLMDNVADPDITFDEKGICNYYYEYLRKASQRLRYSGEDKGALENLIEKIKNAGKGKDYDCIIGVSGGVDSTYLAYLTKAYGLRALAVHFDNGWNSELATKNIESALNKLNIDLYTYVIDWPEFKSLQIAFLKASTPDGEIPTDHAILALLFQIASKKGIKYILNGNNFATESVLPKTWSYGHIDWGYIQTINKNFGSLKLKNYPHITALKYFYLSFFKRIKIVSLLNYMPYKKADAMKLLQDELNWKYYGGKHYESVYTRFFQGHILPTKFKIDKRKAHLSSLIFAGQMTREAALEELAMPIYPSNLLKEDKVFVMKKLEFSEKNLDLMLSQPTKTYRDYPNNSKRLDYFRKILNILREKGIMYS